MIKAAIFILDGCLANYDHRKNEEQDKFYDTIHRDKANPWCKELIDALFYKHVQIIIITSRPEKYRDQTKDWLIRHGIRYHKLLMPIDGQSDEESRKYLFEKQIKNKYQVSLCIESNEEMGFIWTKLGLNYLIYKG